MRPVCSRCEESITNFNDAGRLGDAWFHKSCWLETWREERAKGNELPVLSTPLVKAPGDARVLLFILMMHFGLGLVLVGWALLTQEDASTAGAICLIVGGLSSVIGVAALAYSIWRRRQYEDVIAEVGFGSKWQALPKPDTHPE